jgi:hypothetical protein
VAGMHGKRTVRSPLDERTSGSRAGQVTGRERLGEAPLGKSQGKIPRGRHARILNVSFIAPQSITSHYILALLKQSLFLSGEWT